MVHTEIKLKNSISRRIWDNYMKQINRIIKPLADKQRDEILLELQSHVFESMSNDCAGDEESRILNAIEKLGDPVVYLEPIVKDKLLYNTLKSMSPVNVLLLFIKNLFAGIKKFIFSIMIGFGYLISSILFLLGFFKIFYHEIGFYYFGPPWYRFFIGIIDAKMKVHPKDQLGFWLIPIGIGTSIIIYYSMTKLLNRLNKRIQ